MSILRRTNQGGSVANFILVGFILLISLSGALFYLKNYGFEVRSSQTEVAQSEAGGQEAAQEDSNEAVESSEVSENNDADSTADQSIEFPQTGISDFYNLLAVFFLTTSFMYYVKSTIRIRNTF